MSPLMILFARLCVGGVFLASGASKLFDKPGTEASMSRYPFLPVGSGKLIAKTFPYLELGVGVLLVLGLFTRLAALAALLLFVSFTTLIVYDLTHDQRSSCHCFGRLSDEKLTPWAVVRNLFLMALSLLVFVAFDGWLSLDAVIAGGAQSPLISSYPSSLPPAIDAIPVVLLALATVGVIVLGGQTMAMIRATLRGMGFRS